jgi:hypothetical protein
LICALTIVTLPCIMIRPFALRDLALVHRLSEYLVPLHTESALTHNPHPVRDALVSMVSGDYPTLVWKSDNRESAGFIQLQVPQDSPRAHIFFLGATPEVADGEVGQEGATAVSKEINESVWLSLLDQAVSEVGRRGIHSLVAEVSETGSELPVLRRAGFAIYTRQDIWVLEQANIPETRPLRLLRPRQMTDDWDIQLLYANIVPRLVQSVEPLPPLNSGDGWVLREDNELMAFIHVYKGSLASWLRLFIHPNAETRVDEIVMAALQVARPAVTHPVFCCVRRYQSWLQGPLHRAGFSLWGSQAVMVKHTVKHQRKSVAELTAVLETQGIPASAPIVPRYERPQKNGKTSVHDRTPNNPR